LLYNKPGDIVAWDGNLADGITAQSSPFSSERMGSICLDTLTHAALIKEYHVIPARAVGIFSPGASVR
jgi:hypothetical protein